MNLINEVKNKNKQKCEIILKKGNSQNIRDLKDVENIIEKDNTEPIYIFTYLTLLKKFKKDEIEKKIKEYEYFLSKESINKNFFDFYVKQFSSSDLLIKLYDTIITYSNSMNSFQKMLFYNRIMSIGPKYNEDDIKGFVDYKSNKELSIYILVQKIKKGIINQLNKIENYKINNNDKTIMIQNKMLEEAILCKKVRDFEEKKLGAEPTEEEKKLYLERKDILPMDLDKSIEKIKESIIIFSKINTEYFSEYIENLSEFLLHLKNDFHKRFPNIENLEINDFMLLRDFCFFLEHYDFKDIAFHLDKWKNSFSQNRQDITSILQQKSKPKAYQFKLDKDNLILEIYDVLSKKIKIIEIKDIEKYCINCIISYLSNKHLYITNENVANDIDTSQFFIKNITINEYYIEKFLKLDFIEEIYLNKKKNIIENHLIKIFMSPVIKSAFKKICEKIEAFEYFDLLTEENLRQLFQRARILQFKFDLFGLTEPFFLFNYVFYIGIIDSYGEYGSKLLDLSSCQVTQFHEILGHLNIRIQDYLLKKRIYSPNFNYSDENVQNINIKESGDYIEFILFGRIIYKLNINEILFILDEENYYKNELEQFQKKFKECKIGTYKVSDSLSKFLDSLDIKINKDLFNLGDLDVRKDMTGKNAYKDNYFYFKRKRHDHLHPPSPPKVSESTLKYISELEKIYYKELYESEKI